MTVNIITFLDMSRGILYEAKKYTVVELVAEGIAKPHVYGSLQVDKWNVYKSFLFKPASDDGETLQGEVLATNITRDKALELIIEITNKAARECEGCGSDYNQCGPAMWAQQRKCCPDCSHEECIEAPE